MDRDRPGDGSEVAATLTVGPTTRGMVRILVEGKGIEVPMDFEPEEAEEIAEELRAAAGLARAGRRPPPRDGRRRR